MSLVVGLLRVLLRPSAPFCLVELVFRKPICNLGRWLVVPLFHSPRWPADGECWNDQPVGRPRRPVLSCLSTAAVAGGGRSVRLSLRGTPLVRLQRATTLRCCPRSSMCAGRIGVVMPGSRGGRWLCSVGGCPCGGGWSWGFGWLLRVPLAAASRPRRVAA